MKPANKNDIAIWSSMVIANLATDTKLSIFCFGLAIVVMIVDWKQSKEAVE